MKQLFTLLVLLVSAVPAIAQTVVLDHEAPETTTNFQYFGSSLDQTLNQVIANPDPSGVNTSAMVGQFDKPAGSETWAGAFSNPQPSVAITLNGATQICIDVHMPAIGNLSLKVEQSTSGGSDWVRTRANTVVNEWETLCYDVTLNSEEDPMQPAVGETYAQVALFFDFGTVLDTARTYYFDNLTHDGTSGEMVTITFEVGAGNIDVAESGLFIAGGGNFGDPGDNELTDADGDGIYTFTTTRPAGFSSFYTFTNGNCPDYSCKEDISGQPCANPDNFNDRNFTTVMQDTVIRTCFGSCESDLSTCTDTGGGGGGGGETMDSVNITFNVGTSAIAVSEEGIFIAGGGNFGAPGDNPLTDDDGDGVYSITIRQPAGFNSFYTFTNGACADFSCKEDLAGLSCGDPNNFNDRRLPAVTSDTIVTTCFGQCTTDAVCGDPLDPGMITFRVNMADYTGDFDTVHLAGPFNGWSDSATGMTDEDGDGIWEAKVDLAGGTTRFKFIAKTGDTPDWESFGGMVGSCNVENSGNIDRLLQVNGDATLEAVCFNSCSTCAVSTTDLDNYGISFRMHPTVTEGQLFLDFSQRENQTSTVQIVAADGRPLRNFDVRGTSRQTLNVGDLPSGAYFLFVRHRNGVGVRRFLRQ